MKPRLAIGGAFLFYPSIYPSMMEVLVASEKREPMSADLLRQRRNLLVASLVLVTINLAGAEIKNKLSVSGAEVTFSQPDRIIWGVWVLWFYFGVRYLQYLHDEADFGIKKTMASRIQAWFNKIPREPDDRENRSVKWTSTFNWTLSKPEWPDGHHVETTIPVALGLRVRLTACAFLYTVIRTPRFTDYVLPLIVAALPLTISAWDLLTKTVTASPI